MSTREEDNAQGSKFRLSLDGWAVGLALFLLALVRSGVLKRVPW